MAMNKEEFTNTTKCSECPVRELTLFKNVPEERLDDIQRHRKEQIIVPAKSVIFREDDVHGYVYTLFSGWGIMYKTVNNNGKRQILRFILPGDLIGYQANAGGIMSHSVAAITETVFCVFSHEDIKQMLRQDSALAVRLVEMESRDMSLCQSHLMAAGRKTARESIAFLLMELYYRVRLQLPGSFFPATNTIDFPITQEDIGDAVGLTKIHVNRVIKQLIKDELICFHKRQLKILNEKKLCEIAEFRPEVIIGLPSGLTG